MEKVVCLRCMVFIRAPLTPEMYRHLPSLPIGKDTPHPARGRRKKQNRKLAEAGIKNKTGRQQVDTMVNNA